MRGLLKPSRMRRLGGDSLGLANNWDVGLSNDDLLQDFDLSNCDQPGRLRGHRLRRGHPVRGVNVRCL